MTLEQLKQEERELLSKLSINREKQKEINTKKFLDKLGVSIGDIIQFAEGKNAFCGMFSHCEYSGVEPSYPIIKLLKSDGSVGERQKRVYYSCFDSISKVR